MLMTSAFVAFALLLITVVVSATGMHLDRKRLYNLADALALAAADSMTQESFYVEGLPEPTEGAVLSLADAEIRAEVGAYLAANPGAVGSLRDVTVVSASTPDGRTATVSLAARTRPTLVSRVTELWSDGIIVRAESSARAW